MTFTYVSGTVKGNCASGTSESQLFKARRKLRKLLVGEADNAILPGTL